jgi:hypothetical protein
MIAIRMKTDQVQTNVCERANMSHPRTTSGRISLIAPTVEWLQQSLPHWPATWAAYARRAHRWRVPPRWSPTDWWDELDAEALATACEAVLRFDASRGLSPNNYVFHRMLVATLSRSPPITS